MQLAADAVVFLTGIPIAGALILDGSHLGRAAEVEAGLLIAAILGLPSILLAVRARLRRAHRSSSGE
jgi:hypothetical protein